MAELNVVDTGAGGAVGQIVTPYMQTLIPGYSFGMGNGYLEFGSGTPGSLPFRVDQAGNVTAANVLPTSQSFALANNTYKALQQWTVTGQTDDPLPAFGLTAGSQTYSNSTETTQGPAFWFGYNPALLSAQVASSSHGAIGISCFADAGDTWNPATGGHGLEFSPGCFRSANGLAATNAIEIVACDDNTNTVTLSLRCGSGSFTTAASTLYGSIISMSDAAGNGYLTAGPFNNSAYGSVAANTQPGVQINQPLSLGNLPYLYGTSTGAMTALFTTSGALGSGAASWSFYSDNDAMAVTWQGGTSATHTLYAAGGAVLAQATSATSTATSTVTAQGTGATAAFKATSSSGTSQFILNGNATVSAQMVWQKNGSNTWVMQDSGGSSLYLTNNSGNPHFLLTSGANTAGNYNNAVTYMCTKAFVYGSLIVNNGGSALATTATQGFLYIPTCAGVPTGTPVANTGTVPIVFDTTDGELYFYTGGAWVGLAD